jgi:hypothetical protein
MDAPSRSTSPVERAVRFGRTEVKYLLRRSTRSRGIRATIDPRRGLIVTVPTGDRRDRRTSEDAVAAFLTERSSWVLRHLDRLERERAASAARSESGLIHYRGQLHRIRVMPAGPRGRSTVERVGGEAVDELIVSLAAGDRRAQRRLLVDWLRERAADAISEATERHAPGLAVRPSRVDLRDPRSRWGSASRTGRLMFSWRLVLAPPASLETVVVHELAHLRVFGHGPKFWALVAARRPSHLTDRAWLRRHSHALHSALEDMT